MPQPCPHCDQPDISLLRIVLIGEILRAEESMLGLLADVLQQSGLLQLSDEAKAPQARPRRTRCLRCGSQEQATREVVRGRRLWRTPEPAREPSLNLLPSTAFHRVC